MDLLRVSNLSDYFSNTLTLAAPPMMASWYILCPECSALLSIISADCFTSPTNYQYMYNISISRAGDTLDARRRALAAGRERRGLADCDPRHGRGLESHRRVRARPHPRAPQLLSRRLTRRRYVDPIMCPLTTTTYD